jgi:glycosyltransferase involved in cell wall biosynthesis
MKVSIITVALNSAEYIEDCIQSVVSQNYKNIEYIVIDGGSTDGTIEIIKKYEVEIAKWISEPDRGIYDAMNKGLSLATGDIIGILNADDYYSHKDVLNNVVNIMSRYGTNSCYGNLLYVKKSNTDKVHRYWQAGPYKASNFYKGWMPPHPTFFVRTKIYDLYGHFNLTLGTSADYELMLRFFLKHKINTAYIPGILVKMRMGGKSNVSLRNRIAANRMDRLAWKINGLTPNPLTLWLKPLRKIFQFFPRVHQS